jgi:hypothetical protein
VSAAYDTKKVTASVALASKEAKLDGKLQERHMVMRKKERSAFYNEEVLAMLWRAELSLAKI